MEKQQVKLVKSENGQDQYHIFINKVVGKGAFGVVNEAHSLLTPNKKLVVKTIKILDDNKKRSIDKQLKLMSELPLHENLVEVIPIKMYSASNYYIFMEYCDGGTLFQQYVSKKNRNYQEQELYNIFYQCMNGYKVLFDKKILHQDIKPQNILIRKNLYKLADFGLSIFYQGYNFGETREGTLNYIAPQKLKVRNYIGNHKSDIYSFGIMFFEFIVGHHPYVRKNKYSPKQFLLALDNARLIHPGALLNRFTLKFHQFFDIVIKMIKKTESARIGFEEIWDYLKHSEIFEKSRNLQKQKSKQIILQKYDFVVSQVTRVIKLNTDISPQNEDILRSQFQKKLKEADEKTMKMGTEVANYFIVKRLIVYHVDRLARKLVVEKLKSSVSSQTYDRTIFYLMLFMKCILNDLISQLQNPKSFSCQHLQAFRRANILSMDITNLLRKDHEYAMDSLSQLLSQSSSLHKKQIKEIFQIYKNNDQETLRVNLLKNLNNLIGIKTEFIEVSNRPHLISLVSILGVSQMLQNMERSVWDIQSLETMDRKVLSSTRPELIGIISSKCQERGIICGFDMTEIFDEQTD